MPPDAIKASDPTPESDTGRQDRLAPGDWQNIVKYLAKNQTKAVIDVWQHLKVGVLRTTGAIDFPVPPNSKMRAKSSSSLRHYIDSGIRTATPIMTAAATAGLDLRQPLSVLDFGCGVARQIVQLRRLFPQMKLSACDVDDAAVDYVRTAFPEVAAYTNRFDPPLEYSDGRFDLVYSVSIFSHLTLADQGKWLAELARVTRPGGVLCLTVMGAHAIDRWGGLDAAGREVAHRALAERGSFYIGTPKPAWKLKAEQIMRFGSNLIGIDKDYGDTFYSERYILENWSTPDLEVVSWIPGIIDNLQDLVVLRRKG
jgi:SAM-dependent methyltransferase